MSLLDAPQVLRTAFDDVSASLKVKLLNSFVPTGFDYVSLTQPNGTTDVWAFKSGGSGGTTVGTITLVYTDNTHNTIASATRT